MSNPIGTIISYYGNTRQIPIGYRYCDGSLADPANIPLIRHLAVAQNKHPVTDTIYLPDLRDQFLRGYHDNVGGGAANPKRTLGSLENSSIGQHRHNFGNGIRLVEGGNGAVGDIANTSPILRVIDENSASPNIFKRMVTDWNRNEANQQIPDDTRPRNIAISFLIKVALNGEELPLQAVLKSAIEANSLSKDVIDYFTELIEQGQE